MFNNAKKVWVRDVDHGFILGRISDIGSDSVSVQLHPNNKTVVTTYDSVFAAEEYDKDVADNCALMYLNEATLLNNLKLRYKKDNIY
ncbi:unnamed protein product, partial [Didymodactylos carnosus]